MSLYTLDPLLDNRWNDLVAAHPRASAFHHQGWLKALAATYSYRPIVLTGTPPGVALADGIAFCEVKSWITGTRLVSLPFSDHAQPLQDPLSDLHDLTEWVKAECHRHKWKYVEFRPLFGEIRSDHSLVASQSFWLHTLDLAPSLERLYGHLHKNCIQRRILRAEREQLTYEKGCSMPLLGDFYRLLIITRRRHHLPPQPFVWFQNLVHCMGPGVQIRLARKDGVAIAALFTLRHRGTVTYKYGCSDEKFHQLAGMPFLFWKLIEESKAEGAEQIDFGRTDLDNEGLVEFKDRLGTARSRLTYFRFPEHAAGNRAVAPFSPLARRIFSLLPNTFSSIAGRMLYRHIG